MHAQVDSVMLEFGLLFRQANQCSYLCNKNYFYATVYASIVYIIKEKQINIIELSAELGYSPRHYYKCMREAKPITFSMLYSVCCLLNVSVARIMLVARIGCWFTDKMGRFVNYSSFKKRFPNIIFS
jgi:DNA-binding Xre family transcriptional regulator